MCNLAKEPLYYLLCNHCCSSPLPLRDISPQGGERFFGVFVIKEGERLYTSAQIKILTHFEGEMSEGQWGCLNNKYISKKNYNGVVYYKYSKVNICNLIKEPLI